MINIYFQTDTKEEKARKAKLDAKGKFLSHLADENKKYEEAIVNLKNLRNERTVCIEESIEESSHHSDKRKVLPTT